MKNYAMIMATCAAIWTASCAEAIPIIKTVLDIATDLCISAAAHHPEGTGKIPPEQWCQIPENIQPFIAAAEDAKEVGSKATGLEN